jgi:protein phosphatase
MALGGKNSNIEPQTGCIDLSPGDQFVICSDGLIDGLWDRTIQRLLTDPPPRLASLPPARRLLQEALDESGRDNTTVLVVGLRS